MGEEPRRLPGAVCRFLVLLGLTGAHALADDGVVVRPGSVVVWRGEETSECELDGRRWSPIADSCYLPVDLRRTGRLVAHRLRGGQRERVILRVGDYPYAVQRLTIEDETRVHLSAADLERVERENRRIAALWNRGGSPRFTLPLGAPLDPLPEGGRFGVKRVINDEPRSPHTGADYGAPRGTPVKVAAGGVVALAEEHFFAGNSVFVDHGDGLISMYFHLDEILVAAGESVGRGAVIGLVGSTGRATGPHLHFGLRWHAARIDPALLLGPVEELPVLGR